MLTKKTNRECVEVRECSLGKGIEVLVNNQSVFGGYGCHYDEQLIQELVRAYEENLFSRTGYYPIVFHAIGHFNESGHWVSGR